MSEKSYNLKFMIQVVDRITRPFRQIGTGVSKTLGAVMVGAKRLGLDRVGRDLGRLTLGFANAGKEAWAFGTRIATAGLAAGTALGGLVKWSANAADTLAKTADKLGVNIEKLQMMRHAAGLGGIAEQTFDMALQRFTRRAAEAAAGTGEAKDALAAMDIQLKDTNGNLRPAEDLLADVADKMAAIDDPAKRVRIAFKLFDSEGVSMVNMLKNGSAGLKEAYRDAEQLGLITEKQARASEAFNDNWARMVQLLKFAGHTIAGEAMPAFNDFLIRVRELAVANKPVIIDAIRDGMSRLGEIVTWLWSSWDRLTASLGQGEKALTGLSLALGGVTLNIGAWVARAMSMARSFGMLESGLSLVAAALGIKFLYAVASLFVPMARLTLSITIATVKLFALAARGIAAVIRGLVTLAPAIAAATARMIAFGVSGIASMVRGMIALAPAVVAAIAKVLAFNAALLANPITWVVAAVAALAGAAYLIYRNWDAIAGFFTDLWQSVSAAFSVAWKYLVGALGFDPMAPVTAAWSSLVGFFNRLLDDVRAAFESGFLAGLAEILTSFNPAALIIGGLNELVKTFAGVDLLSIGEGWVDGLWNGISERMAGLTRWLSDAVGRLTSFLPDWAKEKLGLETPARSSQAGQIGGVSGAIPSALPSRDQRINSEATVKVEFTGAPAGMRVRGARADKGVNVDVKTGYAMGDAG